MPKQKTLSGAKKRFRVTGSGKIMRNHAYHSHLLTKKSRTQKKRLLKSVAVHKVDVSRVKKMLNI